MSRFLVVLALLFEIVGVAWGFMFHLQARTLNQFFEQPQWPVFIGVILLLVAVFNGLLRPKAKKVETIIPPAPKDNISTGNPPPTI